MTLKKGDKAPAFKLYNTEKHEISLDDFNGKTVVLHFFPQAFTGTCTKQLCAVRDEFPKYHNNKTETLAISVDSTFTLNKFKEIQNYQFTMLSDFNRMVVPHYSGFYENFSMAMQGVAKRAVYVIDGNGIIQYTQTIEVAGDMPDFAALDAALEAVNGVQAGN